MADKKIEKALYGPSTFEVALGAVLGLLVGVFAACVFLLFKPVQTVRELPQEPERGVVYYLPGSTDASKARGWQAKQATFAQGGEIVLNEQELNAWAASLGGGAGAPGQPGAAKGNDEFLSASGLNFRLEGERLHISQKVTLNYFGLTKEVVMQATGDFERSGETFVFDPEQVYLGSCPLHMLPGTSGALLGALLRKQKVSDEFRAAWAKVTAIVIENGLLKITTQP